MHEFFKKGMSSIGSISYKAKRRQIIVSAFICCAFVVIITFGFFLVQSLGERGDGAEGQQSDSAAVADKNILSGGNPDLPSAAQHQTEYVTVASDEIYRGPLILVNAETAYRFPEDETEISSVYEEKNEYYKVSSRSEALHGEALKALNEMTAAFFEETGLDDIMVNSSYRTMDEQRKVYESTVQIRGEEYAQTYVSMPGYSEHHTGLAADLAIYTDEGSMYTFDGRAEYNWIYEHCAEFGFVMRYPENKTDITGIGYESWHFRYVSEPHALAMTVKGLCLEEYIEYVRLFTYEGDRLTAVAPNGERYEIYYVAAESGSEQQIPVPEGSSYQISGNNIDGFVVAVYTGTAA